MELRKIEITTDTTIYVGYYGVHDCLKQGMAMEEFLGVLTDRKGKPLILKMKRCPVCGKVYLRGDKYQRLWCPLKNYSFIRTKTGRPTSESDIGTVQSSGIEPAPVDWDEIYPTPDYLVRALRHPYQGGRCSGK